MAKNIFLVMAAALAFLAPARVDACEFVDPMVIGQQSSEESTARLQQMKRGIVLDSSGDAYVITPGGTVKMKKTELSPSEFNKLKAKYRVQRSSAGSAGDAVANSNCGPDGFWDFGVYGVWQIGSYMNDPAFWFSLQMDYLAFTRERQVFCRDAFNACVREASEATSLLNGMCGVVGGVNPYIGSACLIGSEWARGKAEQDCWKKYYRCLGLAMNSRGSLTVDFA